MGRTGAKSTQKSGNLLDGLKKKDLKLTVIFAPVSRSELFDVYNPVECPVVDRQMRVISRLVDSSGEYVPETQDKVIFINCASANCIAEEDGPIVDLTPQSLEDKLGRAIQIIRELLDYWHGYYGTVFTTFCCYQPLEGLMAALQTVLKCPPFVSSSSGVGVSMAVPAKFEDAFDFYYDWTFVAKHSSIYKGEFKYEVYNDKSPEENLQDEINDLLKELGEKDPRAKEKFDNYLNSAGTFRSASRLGLEGYLKYHPEYQGYLTKIDRNRKEIDAIHEKQQKEAEAWSHKSEAQRRGIVKRDINKYYDDKIKKTEAKNDPFMRELEAKRQQLGFQQTGKSQFNPNEAQRAYDAYDIGVELHGETHSRDTIEYEGEYYTMDELNQMYDALSHQKLVMEQQKEKAWRKARDEIRKQVYMETLDAGLAIFGIVSIVLTPLVLVDVIVIIGKMFTVDGYAKDLHNWAALGLDVFALVPFVGAVFKFGKTAKISKAVSEVTHAPVAETIAADVSKQGHRVLTTTVHDFDAAAKAEKASAEFNQARKVADDVINPLAEKEATERAAASKLKGQAEELTAKHYTDVKEGNAFRNGGEKNDIRAGDLHTESLQHEANAEAARVAKEAAQKEAVTKMSPYENALLEANQEVLGITAIGADATEVVKTLPIISLGGYINELSLYVKNFSNMSGAARATAAGNLAIQGVGRGGNVKTFNDSVGTLTSGPSYTVQQSGDDFVLVVRN